VLAVNLTLLPPALRPGAFSRVALALSGLYFFALSGVTLYFEIEKGNAALGYAFLGLMVAFLGVLAAYAAWLARRGGERRAA
jgi:cell division protein FtsX